MSNFSTAKNKFLRYLIIGLFILIPIYSIYNPDERIKLIILFTVLIFYMLGFFILIFKYWLSFKFLVKNNVNFISAWTFLIDFSLLTGVLFIRIFNKSNLDQEFKIVLATTIYFSWFSGGIAYHHFSSKIENFYFNYIWPYIKTYIFLFITLVFVSLSFSIETTVLNKFIVALAIYVFLSFLFYTLRFFRNIPPKEDINRIKFIKATDISDIDIIGNLIFKGNLYSINGKLINEISIYNKLKEIYLKKFPKIFDYLSKRLELKSFNINRSLVIRSRDPYNIEVIPDNSLEFLLNLHPLNDIRRINSYLIEVNRKLIKGGVFVCCFENTEQRYLSYIKKYPFFLALFFYFFDFIWHRIFPRINLLQKLYFGITKGKNRALPLAEILGRLVYCGFNFVDFKEIDLLTYVIVFKVKEPLNDVNPSYGPLIKMKRIGHNGKEIYVYKMRTMHPYSEYIQSLVYDLFKVKEGGKLKNDFRITVWGKILRKLWIDELPMLINFLKRELKLVGVRPLSKHYFNLYPDDLKKLRVKTKPGLVPPFYFDLPQTMDEIFESERKYLESYFKNPVLTDIKYFFRAFYNIIIKNARSS